MPEMALCISPIGIPSPSGKGKMFVSCGRCVPCIENRRAEWTFRVSQEIKKASSAFFITLTYDEDHLNKRSLDKRDLQLFFKKLRKRNSNKLKYYAVGEYGSKTWRPHYHIILFNLDLDLVNKIEEIWEKGFVKFGTVTNKSIHYVTGYITNYIHKGLYDKLKIEAPFNIMSKRLGYDYMINNYAWHKKEKRSFIISDNGMRRNLPRYYKKKIFNYKELDDIRKENLKRVDESENEAVEKSLNENVNIFEDKLLNYNQKKINFNKNNKKGKI